MKGTGRRLGNNNNIAFHVYYAEDINEMGGKYSHIKDWKKEREKQRKEKTLLKGIRKKAEWEGKVKRAKREGRKAGSKGKPSKLCSENS